MGYSYNFNPNAPYQRPVAMGAPGMASYGRPASPALPLYGRPATPAALNGLAAPRFNPTAPGNGFLAPLPGLPTPSQLSGPTFPSAAPPPAFSTSGAPALQKPQIQNHYYTVNTGKEPASKKKNIKKFLLTTGAVMTGMVATVALGFLGLRIAYPQKFKAFKLLDEEVVKCFNSGISAWNKTNSKNPISKGIKGFEAFMAAYKKRPQKVDKPAGYIGRLWNAFLNKQEPVVQQVASTAEETVETSLLSKFPQVAALQEQVTSAMNNITEASNGFIQVANDLKTITPDLKDAVQQTQSILTSVQPGIEQFNSTFSNTANASATLDSLLTGLKPQIQETVSNMQTASQAAIAVTSDAQVVIKNADKAIADATGHIGQTAKQAQVVMKKATGQMDKAAQQAQVVMQNADQAIADATDHIGQTATQAQAVMQKADKAIADATEHIGQTATQAQVVMQNADKAIADATDHIGQTATQAQAVMKKGEGAINDVQQLTASAQEALPAIVEAANHVRDLSARANAVTNPLSWFGRGSKKATPPTDEVFHDALETLTEGA
ncbi:hypothetical protein [Vampirovibrio chlorellavorus]|uniref:hypothetical protein n=1 Tax=Vampirovibrio chlorellavorus TaxID=758823 RepID=UPI0026E98506|nr:hypothetical protein [Vampirovibrio chlorellavorus]